MPAWVAVTGSTVGGSVTVNVDARARRAAAVVAVRPDPAADAGFVGRDTELAELLGLLAPGAEGSGVVTSVVVSAVAGAPGVGKTALAQAAARAAVAHGWFSGGAVSVDLHGYDPDPGLVIWPAQLYAALLRALGVPGGQIPPTEVEQATMYHQLLDRLTEDGRAVLLVADNVGDAEQVEALLPGGVGGHRVLITSRDTLGRLAHARLLDLHVLAPAAAVELLGVGLRRRRSDDERVMTELAAALQLVELCGRLPLAVQIAAALLGDEPDRALGELADELADEGDRLRGLDYDGRWAVRAAFDLSYRRLDSTTAELFRWLAAAPGTDVGLAVAAVVADRTQPAARAGLRALCRAHLLDQQPAPPGQPPRWRMHDLIRLYATELLTTDEQAAGFARVLAHYRHTADLAERRFTALPVDLASVPAGFDTAREALAWVLQERTGLVVCVTRAIDTHPEDAARLAIDLAPILDRARLLADWIVVASAAVHAARHSTNRTLAAASCNNLGNALRQVRRFDEAITAHEQARDIFRETSDRHGEGAAWNNLGVALGEARRFDEAITAHEQARDIFRKVWDRHGEGMAWDNLGLALREVRRFDEAITAHEQDLAICQETGDRHGEGMAWNNLGNALVDVGRFDEAITAHEQDLAICREVGDRHGEGTALGNLGLALVEVHRFDEAITAQKQAGAISRETGDRHGEGRASDNLGVALVKVHRFDEAITAHEQAREVFRETGDRHSEGTTWGNLGVALVKVHRFDEAITAHERAGEIYRETRDAYGQARTLENLGWMHAKLNRPQRAQFAWAEAVDLYTAAGAEDDAGRVRQAVAGLDR